MATVFEVYAVHPDEQYAAQAAQAAFDLVDRLERELSRFLPNSDITRINQLAAGEHTRVTPVDARVPRDRAAHVRADRRRVRRLDRHRTAIARDRSRTSSSCARATSGVQIDLGGIGKGYAVDLVAELLEEWGLERSLVHGGFSSLLALEPPADDDGWPLTLSDPRDPSRVLARLSRSARPRSARQASARRITSSIRAAANRFAGGSHRGWRCRGRGSGEQGEQGGSGEQGEGPRLAAAAVADALTTAFMMLSVEEIDELCARTPGVEAWLLPDDDARAVVHIGGSDAP